MIADNFFPLVTLWNFGISQEEKKAASEKKAVVATSTKGQEESAQKAKDVASPPSDANEAKRRLPLGASVSSVPVDYEAFQVGTGQASQHTDSGCVVNVGITCLGYLGDFKFFKYLFNNFFPGRVEKTDFLLIKMACFHSVRNKRLNVYWTYHFTFEIVSV